MSEVEFGLKLIESYRTWAQWLVTLDFAAIGAVAFLYRFNQEGISSDAKWVLLPFGISILAASMVVGNLSSVVDRYVESNIEESNQQAPEVKERISISQIKSMDINVVFRKILHLPTPLWIISAIGGISFTIGALGLAFVTAFRSFSIGKKGKSQLMR